MAVTDDQIAVLRSLLAADFETHHRLTDHLDKTNEWDDYPALVAAAFYEGAHRRFGKTFARSEIIQFVADARARFDHTGGGLDANVAERLIVAALEDDALDGVDDQTLAQTQIVLLGALIFDEGLDEAGLDKFMTDARELADEWIAGE